MSREEKGVIRWTRWTGLSEEVGVWETVKKFYVAYKECTEEEVMR